MLFRLKKIYRVRVIYFLRERKKNTYIKKQVTNKENTVTISQGGRARLVLRLYVTAPCTSHAYIMLQKIKVFVRLKEVLTLMKIIRCYNINLVCKQSR